MIAFSQILQNLKLFTANVLNIHFDDQSDDQSLPQPIHVISKCPCLSIQFDWKKQISDSRNLSHFNKILENSCNKIFFYNLGLILVAQNNTPNFLTKQRRLTKIGIEKSPLIERKVGLVVTRAMIGTFWVCYLFHVVLLKLSSRLDDIWIE